MEFFSYFFFHKCRSIPILILGLKESGKTEIAYRLMNKKREEFLSTKGCRTFSTKIDKRLIKFTELGGEEFYDIWKYYFLDVSSKFIFGKIFGKVMKKMLKFTYLDDYLNGSVKNGDELNRVIF